MPSNNKCRIESVNKEERYVLVRVPLAAEPTEREISGTSKKGKDWSGTLRFLAIQQPKYGILCVHPDVNDGMEFNLKVDMTESIFD
tara:strand:- start:2416 stop:2673 length:258 start_codon:yes stop_codon:yes gene_type:complete